MLTTHLISFNNHELRRNDHYSVEIRVKEAEGKVRRTKKDLTERNLSILTHSEKHAYYIKALKCIYTFQVNCIT